MIIIEYNAAYCKLLNIDPKSDVYKRINNALTYIDSSQSYINKYGPSFSYKDPTVNLLKNNKFYTGLLARVTWVLENCNAPFKLVKNMQTVDPSTSVLLPPWLYEHQVEMINSALLYRRGLVSAPTGSGKSLAMAWLVKHFPTQKIILTVPEKTLLSQLKKSIEETLQEPVGEISGTKKEFKRVTVGIINSLAKLAENSPSMFENVEVLICDEAHKVGSNFYQDLCTACINTDYRIGFSATPWREGGDDKVMEGLLGPVIYEVKVDDLIKQGILSRPVYIEVPYHSAHHTYPGYNSSTGTYNTRNGKPDRNQVYTKSIVYNTSRNDFIVELAMTYLDYIKTQRVQLPCLVLIHQIEHGEILQNLFNLKDLNVPLVYGKTSSNDRKQLVQELKDGDTLLAIASSVFNEGQDIPNLGLGILCGGGGSESRIIQQLGRFIRSYPGKEKGVFIDIADNEQYYLYNNYITRRNKITSTYSDAYKRVTKEGVLDYAKTGFEGL